MAKFPPNFHRSTGLEWVEHNIEGWVTKIRLHKYGTCIYPADDCEDGDFELHERTLGVTVYSRWNMTLAESDEYEYIFTIE